VDISNDSTLLVNGNLTNNGNVRLGFYGGTTDKLDVTGTLTNNGMIQMLDGVGDPILAGSLNNTGALIIGTGDAFILTGGLGITDIAAGSSIDVQGDLYLQSGGVGPKTSAFSSLTSVEGALTLENGETTAITPTTGTLAIASTGSFTVGGGHTVVNVTGDVMNQGSLIATNGGNAFVSGNVLNSGNVIAGTGSTLGITGSYQQTAGTTNIAGTLSAASFSQSQGTTIVQSGGTLSAPTVQVTGGSLQGGGTILGNLSLTGGTLLPGTPNSAGMPGSPDTLSIMGNYTQGPNGTLVIDFDGATGDYSALDVSGMANLSGVVDFTSLDGVGPAIGDEFTFLTFGALAGDFSNIVFTNFSCPVGAICEDVVGANSMTLEIMAAPTTTAPEPSSFVLLASGLLACCGYVRGRKRA
jgi:hypothetical protein